MSWPRSAGVIDKRLPGATVETFFVLDATTGQNGLAQAKAFHDAVGLTGVVLTKLDSTAKGGIVFAIEKELGVPCGPRVGEQADDLLRSIPRRSSPRCSSSGRAQVSMGVLPADDGSRVTSRRTGEAHSAAAPISAPRGARKAAPRRPTSSASSPPSSVPASWRRTIATGRWRSRGPAHGRRRGPVARTPR